MPKKKSKKRAPKVTKKRLCNLSPYQIIGVVFTFIIFLLVTLLLLSPTPKPVDYQDQVLASETNYWEKIIAENPTYHQAYLELALIEFENGNIEKAKRYYTTAKQISPNSEAFKSFEVAFED